MTNTRSTRLKQEKEFFNREWTFPEGPKSKWNTLKAGNFDYPFQVIIEGNMPESVEGLDDSWVVYRMKATIERGRLAHNISTRKHLRVVRTLGPTSLELAHGIAIKSVWKDKIDYSMATPAKSVIFGTAVQANIRLIPILKGLKIGKIQIKLNETQELKAFERRHKYHREVVVDEFEIEEHSDPNGQEGYDLTRTLQLPKTLKKCLQGVDTPGLKVRHRLSFNIALINPDGHVSELRGHIPLLIYISPNLPLDESNNLVNRSPLDARAIQGLEQHAPPLYGEHLYDQLYSDIDPSGYMTPAENFSNTNTPFASRSRNASTDNIDSLAAATQATITAQQLQQELNNLPDTDHRGSDNTLSRHVTNKDQPSGSHTPNLLTANREVLSKVPSYNTAIRTPAPTDGAYLPHYTEILRSRPPSPIPQSSELAQEQMPSEEGRGRALIPTSERP